jgi:hypothetical protein
MDLSAIAQSQCPLIRLAFARSSPDNGSRTFSSPPRLHKSVSISVPNHHVDVGPNPTGGGCQNRLRAMGDWHEGEEEEARAAGGPILDDEVRGQHSSQASTRS